MYQWPINTGKDAQYHLLSGKCKSKPQEILFTFTRMARSTKKQVTASVADDEEKLEPANTAGRNVKWLRHFGKEF